MSNRVGRILILLGAVLVTSALILILFNIKEGTQAGEVSDLVLTQVQEVIPEEIINEEDSLEMTVKYIDGYGYIGYLSIPNLDLELPIISDCDEERLKIAPCRQFGSSKSDDLVIAGHNYRQHFGSLPKLQIGHILEFTDMEGVISSYSVEAIQVIEPTDVEVVRDSERDLILYTCTYGGQNRVSVHCVKIE